MLQLQRTITRVNFTVLLLGLIIRSLFAEVGVALEQAWTGLDILMNK
ncbi:hypothetical protein G6549_17330 [Bacillus sp. MM2020_1]|nr:hypothetical protein [Bacillus sp. MM2020_1]